MSKPLYVCGFMLSGYLLYNPTTKLIERSCNVKLDKKYMYRDDFSSPERLRAPYFSFSDETPKEQTGTSKEETVTGIEDIESLQCLSQQESKERVWLESQQRSQPVSDWGHDLDHLTGTEEMETQESVRKIELSQDIPFSQQPTSLTDSQYGNVTDQNRASEQLGFDLLGKPRKDRYRKVKIRDCPEQESDILSSDSEE